MNDFSELLSILISNESGRNADDVDAMLDEILQKVHNFVPAEIRDEIKQIRRNGNGARGLYLKAVLYSLNGIRNTIRPDGETFLSSNQLNSVKIGVEISICMAIPCLLPGVGVGIQRLCPSAAKLSIEKLTDLQKYDRLSAVARTLVDCFEEITLRPAVLPQFGPLLAALLQLSVAPLAKPCGKDEKCTANVSATGEFVMSTDVYKKLKLEQELFKKRLLMLIAQSPQAVVIKELMIILGVRSAPNWLRKETRRILISMITKPRGVAALVLSVCDGDLDSGLHWSKLDVVARLIATPQSSDPDGYYNSICTQLLDLLNSNAKDTLTVANWCMYALHETNPIVFAEKIFNAVASPLLVTAAVTERSKILKTETEVTKCIENLSKCFLARASGLKSLPTQILRPVAVPLFRLYNKAYRTVYAQQNNIRQLLILLLKKEDLREDLFSEFLGRKSSNATSNYAANWIFQFGANGEFEIANQNVDFDPDESGDCLLNLVQSDPNLSYNLFCYLLKSLPTLERNYSRGETESPPTLNDVHDTDRVRDMEIELVYAKLLSVLAETSAIQEAHVSNPEHLISFVKSLIEEKSQHASENKRDVDTEFDVLYIGLMLLKVILSNRPKSAIDWKRFDALIISLNEMRVSDTQSELSSLAKEVGTLIKTRGASARPRYQDMSQTSSGATEFERALEDLADPLLPVRAHGLMSLTKLIERSDPAIIAKKDVVMCLFQENLKHEDSFIYLSAINGIAMLATSDPLKVIELLVNEYIDVTSTSDNGTISPDTRAKIGEILVRVTRSLGGLAPNYKNLLINGFLCGARDVDPMVRASSLSCLGELCKVLGYRLGSIITEVIFCIGRIIETDKTPECRRAGVLVATLLLQGLGKAALTSLGTDLVPLYRGLSGLRNNDPDPVLRLHAQLALDEFDGIARDFLFSKPRLEKHIFLLE